MKLCLGVRVSLVKYDWRSVDLLGNPDIRGDAFHPPIPDGTCSEILSSHVLEHYAFSGRGEDRIQQTIGILRTWYSKMEAKGRLVVCVPDGSMIAEVISKQPGSYWKMSDTAYVDVLGPLFGGGDDFTNYHHMIFTEACLSYCLEQSGFSSVRRITAALVPLPKFNGSSQDTRSLNVEGMKA